MIFIGESRILCMFDILSFCQTISSLFGFDSSKQICRESLAQRNRRVRGVYIFLWRGFTLWLSLHGADWEWFRTWSVIVGFGLGVLLSKKVWRVDLIGWGLSPKRINVLVGVVISFVSCLQQSIRSNIISEGDFLDSCWHLFRYHIHVRREESCIQLQI